MVLVAMVEPFWNGGIGMFASRMHAMSGSPVWIDRVIPVRLNPEMFCRDSPTRTRSPGSPKASPSPQAFVTSAEGAPPAQVAPSVVQARPTFGPEMQARVVGAPVQVFSSARSRTIGESRMMFERGTFLQVAAMAKKGPLAT